LRREIFEEYLDLREMR